MSYEECESYIRSLQPTYKKTILNPHDFQVEAFKYALCNNRCVLLSPTSSGKSLIIYAMTRWHVEEKNRKVLIIVPNTGLVAQMAGDMLDYSSENGWADANVQIIMEGETKNVNRRVVISTWQSIYKLPKSWFDQFDVIIGDEAHHFKAKSLAMIMEKASRSHYRVALTGTLDSTEVHRLAVESHFGAVYNVTTTKNLMDRDIVSLLTIEALVLKHPPDIVKAAKGLRYAEEMDFLCQNTRRNEFIVNLVDNMKGNTLVLFQFVEKHGKIIYEMIKKKCPNRNVYFIYGKVDSEERMKTKDQMEENENDIIVASYPTFSTGISIRKLHNVVFASPFKSDIRLRQSIGRQLRKHPMKKKAVLYDIGDCLVHNLSAAKVNYTLDHFKYRVQQYRKEGFEYHIRKINL
jgi:superfamily II DNA or RNA helicase